MKHRILIPGAGYGQEILIRKAKELGFYVIVVSPPGDYPGLHLGDKLYHADVRDKDEVLRIAEAESIQGIVSDQNDIPVETIGYVSEKMGLTGNDYATSKLFSRKNLMREKCLELGFPTVPFIVASDLDSATRAAETIGFPLMCKPVDNQSSRGVYRCDNKSDFDSIINISFDNSFTHTVVIEKYIAGKEYVVEGLAIDGHFKNMLILERSYFKNEKLFIPSMVTSPTSLDAENIENLKSLNHSICTSFGISNGLTHSEFILSDLDGMFYLVETAARGGGVFTSSHLLSHACGFDSATFLLELSLGKKLSIDHYPFAFKAVRYICFYLEPGVIQSIEGLDAIKNMPGVLAVYDDNLVAGSVYPGLHDKSDRLGPILLGGDCLDHIVETTNKIRSTLSIKVGGVENAIVWD